MQHAACKSSFLSEREGGKRRKGSRESLDCQMTNDTRFTMTKLKFFVFVEEEKVTKGWRVVIPER